MGLNFCAWNFKLLSAINLVVLFAHNYFEGKTFSNIIHLFDFD